MSTGHESPQAEPDLKYNRIEPINDETVDSSTVEQIPGIHTQCKNYENLLSFLL